MRYGLALPQFGAHCDATAITSFVRNAEVLGYQSLWVGDRVLAPVDPSDLYPGGTPERPYPTGSTDEAIEVAAQLATTIGFG